MEYKLTVEVQHNENYPDCNHLVIDGHVIGAIQGTLKMGTSDFDKRFKIAEVRHDGKFVATLWDVEVVPYVEQKPVEVK